MVRAIIFLLEILLITSAAGDILYPSEAMRKPKSIYKCENHVARLQCGHPSTTIRIHTAKYGRDLNYICNSEGTQKAKCAPVDKTDVLRKYCDHKSSCMVPVSSTTLGVVCPHVDKFLNVIYMCVRQDPFSMFVQSTTRAPETTTATPSAKTENTRKDSTTGDSEDTWVKVDLSPAYNHGNRIAHLGGFVSLFTQITAVMLITSM